MVNRNASSCWFWKLLPKLSIATSSESVLNPWPAFVRIVICVGPWVKKSVICTLRAAASLCNVATVGEFSPCSIRLIALKDSPHRSASPRSERPASSRNCLIRVPMVGFVVMAAPDCVLRDNFITIVIICGNEIRLLHVCVMCW